MTNFNDTFWDKPFHQISRPVVDAPGDATTEYDYLFGLAKRLGIPIHYAGGEVDTSNPPDDIALLELLYPEGATKVTIGDIASHPRGKIYQEYAAVEVMPAMEGMEDKLQFMPEGVMEEFELLKNSESQALEDDQYLLICRRNPHVYNSMCHEFPQAPADNPAWLHPDDMNSAGLRQGQQVLVTSAAGKVTARVEPDDTMRRGVVSMSHGFGGKSGSPVAQLLTTKGSTDRYTRMPQMTAIPVNISAV